MFKNPWLFSNCSFLGFCDNTQSISSCFSSGPFAASCSSAKWEPSLLFFNTLFAFLSLYLFPGLCLSITRWWLPFFHLKAFLWSLGSHPATRPLHLEVSQEFKINMSTNYILSCNLLSDLLHFLWSYSVIVSTTHLAWIKPEIWASVILHLTYSQHYPLKMIHFFPSLVLLSCFKWPSYLF